MRVVRVKVFADRLIGIEPVTTRDAAEGFLFNSGLKVPSTATQSAPPDPLTPATVS
jgi:hypothetical protein